MKELIAFVLPPATALVGMRLMYWILGKEFNTRFGLGLRFAIGLGVGMLVFSQFLLFCSIAGLNVAAPLAYLALIWGIVELFLLAARFPAFYKATDFRPTHLWMVFLLPLIYWAYVLGRLSTLEGTLEFDANAFWVFKAKILYLMQGRDFINTIRLSNLGYMHMDYPWLVAGIYTLGYGAVGGVDEFINKVWPFWMVITLCIGFLSLAKIWARPNPLPIAVVTILAFLPATLHFVRFEGGTMPLVFYACLIAILLFYAMVHADNLAFAAAMPAIAGCAMVKLEGVMYGFFWLVAVLPFVWKNKWFMDKTFWKSAGFGMLCLIPFVIYRLLKPTPYSMDLWWKAYLADFGPVFDSFLKAFALYFGGRFFNGGFFHWQLSDTSHLKWNGQWSGISSLVNEQMSILLWVMLFLLILSLWKKPQKLALICLSAATFAVIALITLALIGVAYITWGKQDTTLYQSVYIDWNCSDDVGRYFYPFFVAWFLAVVTLWFWDGKELQPQPVQPNEGPLQPPARKSKKKR